MASRKVLSATLFLTLFSLAGCFEKSVEYYAEHQDEALKMMAECHPKGLEQLTDKDCVNSIKGNAIAHHKKTVEAAAIRAAALDKWHKEAQAQAQKK